MSADFRSSPAAAGGPNEVTTAESGMEQTSRTAHLLNGRPEGVNNRELPIKN